MLGLKEKIQALICRIEWFRYERKRHFYIFMVVFLLVVFGIFSLVMINQQKEITVRENILKSFYSDLENPDHGSGNENRDESGISCSPGSKEAEKSKNDEFEGSTLLIKVYICGYVSSPGVYELKDGSRIIDVLNLAGGPTDEACLEAVNLASIVMDGQKIYIPSLDEVKKGGGVSLWDSSGSEGLVNSNRTININYATRQELESLPGIGSILAQNIIDYRDKHGFFKSKEELKNVKGIGEKKYREIENLISI